MTDSKTSLAAAETAIQQAGTAFDAESSALSAALAQAAADRDALAAKVTAQASTIADLQAQIAALQPKPVDPWDAIDKTGATVVGDQMVALLKAGHLDIPAGNYLIDPTKTPSLPSGTKGAVDITGRPTTFLIAKPSATPRDCIYSVDAPGAVVENIFAVGDRMAQVYTAGSTNEWGYGAKVTGKGSTLRNCWSVRCTGDGYGVTAANVTLENCFADQNRRQGLSGFNCPGLRITGGAYTNTGKVTVDGVTDAGAPNGPWAGIDIEPDKLASGVPNVVVDIDGAYLGGNQGSGLLGYLRSEVGGSLLINARNCTIIDNTDGVRGEAVSGGVPGKVVINAMHNNLSKHTGAAVRANDGAVINVGSTSLADANTIMGANGPTTRSFTKAGIVTQYDLKAYGTGVINAGVNTYE